MLRELGELLVGRDSTAVIELVKNSYDADATFVTLDATNLGTRDAVLRVVDNGSGMTYERFNSAFLRIASRDKEGGER
ncbi:ATP-binding protein, partial [Saccharothrix longispora]|uniref:ATP-binding protein n=1 Tax=Saccharothrix longispora TaxID=33920 RepID=UPI0028FD7D7F